MENLSQFQIPQTSTYRGTGIVMGLKTQELAMLVAVNVQVARRPGERADLHGRRRNASMAAHSELAIVTEETCRYSPKSTKT